MRLKTFLACLLLWPPLLLAQLTQVSGTVKDPNGLAYSNGTVTPLLVISGTPFFISTGAPYTPPAQSSVMNVNGTFVMNLADLTKITPAGATWTFHVCSGAGSIQPALGAGPVCFDAPGFTIITGTAVDISAQLSAAAPALTKLASGTSVPINTQTVASYHLALSDAGTYLRMNVASANSVTVDPDSVTSFPVGTFLTIRQAGVGITTIVAGAGVTITTPSSLVLRTQNSTVQLIKIAANTWDLIGDVQ